MTSNSISPESIDCSDCSYLIEVSTLESDGTLSSETFRLVVDLDIGLAAVAEYVEANLNSLLPSHDVDDDDSVTSVTSITRIQEVVFTLSADPELDETFEGTEADDEEQDESFGDEDAAQPVQQRICLNPDTGAGA